MKSSLLSALIIIVALAAYSIGANNIKTKPTCCCEHTQQTAEYLKKIYNEIKFVDPGHYETKNIKFKVPPRQPLPTLPRR